MSASPRRLGPGRIHHCMRWIGICERAFDLTCRRAVSRELSPGEPLAGMQAVQHRIAESRAETDAARLLTLDTAERIGREGARAARVEVGWPGVRKRSSAPPAPWFRLNVPKAAYSVWPGNGAAHFPGPSGCSPMHFPRG